MNIEKETLKLIENELQNKKEYKMKLKIAFKLWLEVIKILKEENLENDLTKEICKKINSNVKQEGFSFKKNTMEIKIEITQNGLRYFGEYCSDSNITTMWAENINDYIDRIKSKIIKIEEEIVRLEKEIDLMENSDIMNEYSHIMFMINQYEYRKKEIENLLNL